MITWFNRWPESRARIARWARLLAWLVLIAVLLKPELAPPHRSSACPDPGLCRPGIGNDLFWNVGLPLVPSLDRGIARSLPDLVVLIRSSLTASPEHLPDQGCLVLLRSLSPNVMAFLVSEDSTTTALNSWQEGEPAALLRSLMWRSGP